jgi:hypothetical protein
MVKIKAIGYILADNCPNIKNKIYKFRNNFKRWLNIMFFYYKFKIKILFFSYIFFENMKIFFLK